MIALLNGVLFAYALTSVVELKQEMKLMTHTIDQDTAGQCKEGERHVPCRYPYSGCLRHHNKRMRLTMPWHPGA